MSLRQHGAVGAEVLAETSGLTRLLDGGTASLHVHDVAVLCLGMFTVLAVLWVFYLWKGDGSHPQSENHRTQLLCTSWAACSVAMHVLNKSLVVELETPGCITLMQLMVSVLAFSATTPAKLSQVSIRQLQYWLLVPTLFAGMLCTGFYTNEYFSLSLLMIIRNLSPLIVLPVEMAVMPAGKRPIVTGRVLVSIVIMIAGTLVYCGGTEALSVIGLMFALLNMFLGVSNRVVQRRLLTTECKDLPSDVVMFVTNTMALLPTLALMCAANEWDAIRRHQTSWWNPQVLALLVLSGLVGVGIGYLGFECQRLISATSFVVLQNSTKIVVVLVGILCFEDMVTAVTTTGLIMSLGGSCMYGDSIIRSKEDSSDDERKHLMEKLEKEESAQSMDVRVDNHQRTHKNDV